MCNPFITGGGTTLKDLPNLDVIVWIPPANEGNMIRFTGYVSGCKRKYSSKIWIYQSLQRTCSQNHRNWSIFYDWNLWSMVTWGTCILGKLQLIPSPVHVENEAKSFGGPWWCWWTISCRNHHEASVFLVVSIVLLLVHWCPFWQQKNIHKKLRYQYQYQKCHALIGPPYWVGNLPKKVQFFHVCIGWVKPNNLAF